MQQWQGASYQEMKRAQKLPTRSLGWDANEQTNPRGTQAPPKESQMLQRSSRPIMRNVIPSSRKAEPPPIFIPCGVRARVGRRHGSRQIAQGCMGAQAVES